jgi:BirA family biotin operon repressor/biotin-[acetyl-CoA-carboxylase] ligase
MLFAILSRTTLQRLTQWARGSGFESIRRDWLIRAGPLGRALRVQLNGAAVEGQFAGLDDTGRLLLRLGNGSLETVSAGDVFPLAPAGEMAAL